MADIDTKKKQHLYLVDGSAYIFRAYHRLPPLTNPEGTPVGAVYGYTTMLWKLADDLDKADGPTHLAVVLDKSSQSFRNELYSEYKAHRPDPPEDLVPQFPLIRDATRAFSLPMIEEPDVEADDMIASYAKAAIRKGWDVTIVSSDKDLMQLIGQCADEDLEPGVTTGGCIDMLDTMKDARIGRDEVVEKFGVPPELLGDVLALMGDSVDNIPGIYGIGPKTASKLISDNGSLTAALDAAPEMKTSKLKERLLEGREMAELSRVLVTLKEDCPLPIALDDMVLDGIPPEPLAGFLESHGFHSLLKRLGAGAGSPNRATNLNPVKQTQASAEAAGNRQLLPEMPAVDRSAYECVQTMERLRHWIDRAFAARMVAVDTETSSLDAMRAELSGISLALGPNDACYIPLGHGGSDMFAETPEQVDRSAAADALRPLLESDAVLKVGHNIKYDINILARCANIHLAPVDDTMIVSFDLDAGRQLEGIGGGHGMDELSQRHLSHTTLTFKDICGSGKKQIPFGEVPLDKATEYAAEDADVTWRLHKHLHPRLALEGGTKVYERVDRPLIPVVAAMERNGIKVDRAALARLSEQFAETTTRIEKEIHALAGSEFTIGSPKQLGDVLFDTLGYKGGKKGKSGQYSTDQSILERLAGEGAPIANKVLEWRQLTKLRTTYTDALQAAINPDTGRVHTSYSLVGAQTGRLSSTDPNLQNIPIRTEIGREIRKAFVPEDGNVLLAADYSQIELRLAAHMADVPQLKEAFASGEDIHSRTATEMFGTVDRDTRARAKTVNFAILYGISRWGLAGRLGIEADEAQDIIDTYFKRFPGIQQYIVRTMEQVRERGYSETLFGRKTWFPRITSKNPNERAGSERAAINAPIQGTSADIIKRAMVRMMPALEDAGLGRVRMLLQVHDELVFELPEGDVAAASPVIERVMAEAALPAVKLDVPLGIEIGHGSSWDAAH
ncbi:DNA polymerase I [Altererythrobacter sp. CAU 1778]